MLLLSRLQAIVKLKWRVVRNYARRKPLETILRLIFFGFIPLSWLPMVTQAAREGKSHSNYWVIGLVFWLIFIAITVAQLTIGRIWHTIDLGQLQRFPLRAPDYFIAIFVDAVLNEMAVFMLVLLGPAFALFVLHPSSLPLVLLMVAVFIVFLVAWMHTLAGLRSYLSAYGFVDIIGQLVGFALLAWAAGYAVLPGLAANDMGAFMQGSYWVQRAASAKEFLVALAPLLDHMPPGLASNGIKASLGGQALVFWQCASILALETSFMCAAMYVVSRAAYGGSISLTSKRSKRSRDKSSRDFASLPPFGSGILSRFAGLSFWQLVRKEWLYARRLGTMNVQIVMLPIAWVLVIVIYYGGAETYAPGFVKWMLILAALMTTWLGTEIFAQKFNWDGPAAAVLFLTPVSRREMLAAKSFAVVIPAAATNALGLAAAWVVTGAPFELGICAAAMLGCGLAIGDAHGSLISLIAPVNLQAFHRGRARRNIDQRGCITQFILHFATGFLVLAQLPLFALLAPGLFMRSPALELAGAAACAALTYYYTRWVRADAARMLSGREAAIWRLLKDPF